jgi:Putative phage metallopeptidase
MTTVYDRVPETVMKRITKAMHDYHGELEAAGVTLQVLWAFKYNIDGESEPAMKVHGQVALAKTSVTSLPDRVRGIPDAKIVIDREFGWLRLSETRQTALIDHELTHLRLALDQDGAVKLDDAGRPKLRLRHHDWELTGFAEVAERHGEAAIEVHEMVRWQESYGQFCLFPLRGTQEVKVDGRGTEDDAR